MHRMQRPGHNVRTLVAALALSCASTVWAVEPTPGPAPTPAPSAKPASVPKETDTKNEAPRRIPRPGDIQKVLTVRNVDILQLQLLLRVFPADLSTYRTQTQNAIAVSGAPAVVAAIEETIKRLDVAQPSGRSVELTVWVIEALGSSTRSAPVPPALEAVVAQLKGTFGYATYRLADTLVARARDASHVDMTDVGGELLSAPGQVVYHLSTDVAVTGENASIRLQRLHLFGELLLPRTGAKTADGAPQYSTRDVGINSDIEVGKGQHVVVGKAGLPGDVSSALIFVISAKVVD